MLAIRSIIYYPIDLNCFNLKCDFDNFVNKLRYMLTKPNDENQKNADIHLVLRNTLGLGNPPPVQKHTNYKLPKGKDKHK